MSIYHEWLDRVNGEVIAEGHIRQMVHAVYPLALGYKPGGYRTALTEEEAASVLSDFAARVRLDGGPQVTEEQCEKGARWLHNGWKRLGLPKRFGTEWPLRFRFPGAECVHVDSYRYSDGLQRALFLPRYVAYYADGTELSYRVGSWQSGAYGRLPVEFSYEIREGVRT